VESVFDEIVAEEWNPDSIHGEEVIGVTIISIHSSCEREELPLG